MLVLRPNFGKRVVDGIGGLITVVVQDITSREVLMVAYTDEAGFLMTLKTGLASFYSTSRRKSWVKGETSNNLQNVFDVLVDCDGDAVVYLVQPTGNKVACHTDARTCFYRSVVGKGEYGPAPRAGKDEELSWMEAEVHPRLS